MNLYSYFYCRAFDWYNKTGKKDKDTLRVSSLALVSAFQLLNIVAIVFLISIIQRKTPINKWIGLALAIVFIIYNLIKVSTEKSDILRDEYLGMPKNEKKNLNLGFCNTKI